MGQVSGGVCWRFGGDSRCGGGGGGGGAIGPKQTGNSQPIKHRNTNTIP